MRDVWERIRTSSATTKISLAAVAALWAIVFILFAFSLSLVWERSSEAQPVNPATTNPIISLEPNYGPADSPVTVYGQGWTPGSTVMMYVSEISEAGLPDFALTSAAVDPEGNFSAKLVIPADPAWEAVGLARVVAREKDGDVSAQAYFGLLDAPVEPAEPITATPEPTATSTVEPAPSVPLAKSTTNLNIRSGSGTGYPVVGLIRTGQTAEITGLSPDGRWWQIAFDGADNGRGWVAAEYVIAENTGNVVVVQPPALPPTATPAPTPTSMPITDWRGEYYNNNSLSGSPTLVRNDMSLSFDWGTASPATGINADNFSVRWSRSLDFPAGTYRFYTRVDDGVRLWVDDRLIIDQWHDSAPTSYSTDVTLSSGYHTLRMEYFENSGTALAQLAWEWVESYPDWKGEYFNSPDLSGSPVLVRNDPVIQFSWGSGSPGAGVSADNFSARWTRKLHFSAGTYRFKVLVDDAARLWIDDILIIDRWRSGEPKSYTAEMTLSEGAHRVRLEYFDDRYDAQIRLDWERLSSSYPDWKAEYYPNRKLDGRPILVRNETKIDYDWDRGSPAAGIPADNFSARWTRKANFEEGLYLFRLKVDDGARLWLDGEVIIDSWQSGDARTLKVERTVNAGEHKVKVEYFENEGRARIELKIQKKELPANLPPEAQFDSPYTVDEV